MLRWSEGEGLRKEAVKRIYTRVSMVWIFRSPTLIAGLGRKDLGQDSNELIVNWVGCLLITGYPFPLNLLTFDFNGNSAKRVYLHTYVSVFALCPKSDTLSGRMSLITLQLLQKM